MPRPASSERLPAFAEPAIDCRLPGRSCARCSASSPTRNDAATAAATVPQRAGRTRRGARVVRMAGGEGDHAAGTAVLIDALQDARALARETVGRECLVRFLRHDHLDVVERSSQVRSPRLAGVACLQMGAVGRRDLEVEADLDEPIVGQVWMAHTADLVAADASSAAWMSDPRKLAALSC